MDVVYILKAGYDNSRELRYSLRSLENIEYDRVFIIGHLPNWCVNVTYIPADDPFPIKSLNALHKIKIACNDERISEDFILMNDDFYITRPTEIKYYNKGTIKEHYEERLERFENAINISYIQNLGKTLELFPKGLDFSLHYPIIYNKKKFLEMCSNYDMKEGYLLRNLYCNHFGIKGEKAKDYKVWQLDNLWNKDNLPTFISSNDNMVLTKEFIDFMNDLFPKESKFEKKKQDIEKLKILFTKIQNMKLKGRPNQVINRFGNRYIADNEGILEAITKEEMEIFVMYGFELVEEPKVIKEEVKKPLKSKK